MASRKEKNGVYARRYSLNPREQVKAEEQINYLTKASIGYGIEKRVGKRQK